MVTPQPSRYTAIYATAVTVRRPQLATARDVTPATFHFVTDDTTEVRWLVLVIRLPAEPTRHRVAVWRELRKIGALSLGQGIWAVPDVPAFADGTRRAVELTERAEGQAVTLTASGRSAEDATRFEAMFTAARSEDWSEFLADCDKFEQEIAKEIRTAKFTLAELEEEEQSLERLRRWHRDLTARDVFGAPEAPRAAERLARCAGDCEDYAERVFAALHRTEGREHDGTAERVRRAAHHDVAAVRRRIHHGLRRPRNRREPRRVLRGRRHLLLILGGLLALYDGAEVLLKPLFGTLADRIGARPVLLGGLCAFAAASAVYAIADSPGWLWAARLGQGAAASAFSPSASALVARLNPAAKHGRAFGSYGFYKFIGYTLGPLLGGILVWAGGLRLLFTVMAVLAAAVAVWATLAVPAVPPLPKARQTVLDLARRLTSRTFLAPTAALAGATAALSVGVGFLPVSGRTAGLGTVATGAAVSSSP